MRAVVVNAGNANCATGGKLVTPARRWRTVRGSRQTIGLHAAGNCLSAPRASSAFRCRWKRILRALPVIARFRRPFRSFVLRKHRWRSAPRINAPRKTASASFKMARQAEFISWAARKGAGDDSPETWPTMLAFIATDAADCSFPFAKKTLRRRHRARTFKRPSAWTATLRQNDTLLVLAKRRSRRAHSIKAGTSAHRGVPPPLWKEVCRSLALQIVADGRRARQARHRNRSPQRENRSRRQAHCGDHCDFSAGQNRFPQAATPNWGRIFAAAGRFRSEVLTPPLWTSRCPASRYCGVASPIYFNERAASNKLLAETRATAGGSARPGQSQARATGLAISPRNTSASNASYRT